MRHAEPAGHGHPVASLVSASDGPRRCRAQPSSLVCDGAGCSRTLACDPPAMKAQGRSLLALAGWLLVVEREPHGGERIRAAYCPEHAFEGTHTPVPWLREDPPPAPSDPSEHGLASSAEIRDGSLEPGA